MPAHILLCDVQSDLDGSRGPHSGDFTALRTGYRGWIIYQRLKTITLHLPAKVLPYGVCFDRRVHADGLRVETRLDGHIGRSVSLDELATISVFPEAVEHDTWPSVRIHRPVLDLERQVPDDAFATCSLELHALEGVLAMAFGLSGGNFPVVAGDESVLDLEPVHLHEVSVLDLAADSHVEVAVWLDEWVVHLVDLVVEVEVLNLSELVQRHPLDFFEPCILEVSSVGLGSLPIFDV